MASNAQLSPMDAAFLYHERPEQRLHAGSLLLLDGAVPYDGFTELAGLALAGTLLVAPVASMAAEPAPDPGRAMYFRYCGACHGPQGRGDGVAMPVWGEEFRAKAGWDMGRRVEVQGKLLLITDYVRSLQEPTEKGRSHATG